MTDPAPAALLIVQLILVLAVCRGLGWMFARVRQPLVVAEMVAWFLRGPSFFGGAMSITALPVLARIISERGVAGTAIGSLSLLAPLVGARGREPAADWLDVRQARQERLP